MSGKSRFALSSRKPLKRCRRQAASHSGRKLKDEQLDFGILSSIHDTDGNSLTSLNVPKASQIISLGSPRSLQFQPQYSPTSLSVTTMSKVETMAQHCMWFPFFIADVRASGAATNLKTVFSQVVDMQHVFYNLVGLSRRDEAIFHATLSIASVYYDTGANDLFHCQQTLNLVSRRLSNYALQTSDETIGAVGLLVIHNVCPLSDPGHCYNR